MKSLIKLIILGYLLSLGLSNCKVETRTSVYHSKTRRLEVISYYYSPDFMDARFLFKKQAYLYRIYDSNKNIIFDRRVPQQGIRHH